MLPLEPSTGNIPLRCFSKLLWEFAVNGGRGYFPNLSLLLQCIRIAAGFGQTVFLRSCTGKSRLSQHFKKFWLFSAHNPSRSLCVVLQFSVLALFSLFSSVYWWISNPSTAPDEAQYTNPQLTSSLALDCNFSQKASLDCAARI
jgi:hypothetical protein